MNKGNQKDMLKCVHQGLLIEEMQNQTLDRKSPSTKMTERGRVYHGKDHYMYSSLFWKDFPYLENWSSWENQNVLPKKILTEINSDALNRHVWIRITFPSSVAHHFFFFFLRFPLKILNLNSFPEDKIKSCKIYQVPKLLDSWLHNNQHLAYFSFLTDAGSTEMEEGSCIWL